MIISLKDKKTVISGSTFIAPSTYIIGDVTISEDCGIWFGTTIRGDGQKISIGSRTNIQENCVLHSGVHFPIEVGSDVTIGHSAVVHGCQIGDGSTIGMHATIMNGAVIGKNCIVGAGALVTEGKTFADNLLIIGSPAKAVRVITEEEAAANRHSTEMYAAKAKEMKAILESEE